MGRIAVFVDAGYLFAQGSAVLTGAKVVRTRLVLDESKIVDLLRRFAIERAIGSTLLRIYWYDASPSRGVNANHVRLAAMDDVKMRLGVINAFNQQKGVDSLVIADLIQLSHNRAIDTAVVLSGDEDLRVGVQVAQAYGVRVHLLGFESGNAEASQAQSLVAEADTRRLWSEVIVASFLSIAPPSVVDGGGSAIAESRAEPAIGTHDEQGPKGVPVPQISRTAEIPSSVPRAMVESYDVFCVDIAELVASFSPLDISEIITVFNANGQVEFEYDRRLLRLSAKALGRNLENDEKRFVRAYFVDRVRERAAQQ